MLSWLVTVNITISLLLWLTLLTAHISGFQANLLTEALALPADFAAFIRRPWSAATYMFTQINPLQLIFNMLWLIWFGVFLLDTDSSATLLRLYLGGGLTGAAFYLAACALMPGAGSILMGSSAATLSIMLYTSLRQPGRHVRFFAVGSVRLKWIAIATVILTLLSAPGGTAFLAHLGGLMFPLIYMASKQLRTHFNKKEKTKKRKSPFGKKIHAGMPVPPEEVIDRLLDKIRVSGYASLTASEKALLARASGQLKDNPDYFRR